MHILRFYLVGQITVTFDALYFVIRSGNLECTEVLLRAYPGPLNDDDIDDMTPLLLASDNGHHRVVKFLLKMGADIGSR